MQTNTPEDKKHRPHKERKRRKANIKLAKMEENPRIKKVIERNREIQSKLREQGK